jgi:hypothetical protein
MALLLVVQHFRPRSSALVASLGEKSLVRHLPSASPNVQPLCAMSSAPPREESEKQKKKADR